MDNCCDDEVESKHSFQAAGDKIVGVHPIRPGRDPMERMNVGIHGMKS